MKVVGFDPFISVDSAWSLSSQVHRAANQDEVLAQADYLTVHIPLNDQTRGSIQGISWQNEARRTPAQLQPW